MATRPTIGQGPGNPAESVVMRFKATDEDISRGHIVALTLGAPSGLEISLAEVDQGDLEQLPIGIAKEDIKAGQWGKVVVGGLCDYLITDGTILAGSLVVAKGSSPGVGDVDTNGWSGGSAADIGWKLRQVGLALEADDAATPPACHAIMVFNRFGW